MANTLRESSRRVSSALAGVVALAALAIAPGAAGAEALVPPAPRSATNGALHYQRAILFLAAIEPEKRELLRAPIWEIVTPQTSEEELAEVGALLIEGRHAIRSALVGASQSEADFGLDLRVYLLGSYLPHTDAMTDLGRLVALDALRHQANGEWELAAQRLLLCTRMGRHLARQPTLVEALAGVEVLETAYFALGNWAVRCPDTGLVESVFHVVNAMSPDMVNPARTLNFEAGLAKQRTQSLIDAYPDGPWAEMLIDSLGVEFPRGDERAVRSAAIEAVVARGVPQSVFDDEASFAEFVSRVQERFVRLATTSGACLALPAPASIRKAIAFAESEQADLPRTEYAKSLNPVASTTYFAVHRTELDMLRLVLALSAARVDGDFPASLDGVADWFGGTLPTSSYDREAFDYTPLAGGRGISVEAKELEVGGVTLPRVGFVFEPAE